MLSRPMPTAYRPVKTDLFLRSDYASAGRKEISLTQKNFYSDNLLLLFSALKASDLHMQ